MGELVEKPKKSKKVQCPKCKGAKQINGKDCPTCNGTGEVDLLLS